MSEALNGGQAHRLGIEVADDTAANIATIVLDGRVDVFTYLELARRLSAVHEGRGGIGIVLDLSRVGFVASSGWSVFVTLRNRLSRQGGRVALAGMNGELLRIYRSMKLASLIPTFDDAPAALRAFVQA